MYVEGSARIKYRRAAFLNPEAKLSRDISVAFLSTISNKANSLDATAATGIRAIRYIKESGVGHVTSLEINNEVYTTLKKNILFNKLGKRANSINTSLQAFANTTSERFDVIDLDPFGSAAPYIYDAIKVAKDNTLLLVTATDLAVLCGANQKACMRIYDSKPIHNELGHESAIRILIGYIARVAAQFNFGVEPCLSIYYRHYIRAFLRLRHGANYAVSSVQNLGYLHYCDACHNFSCELGYAPEANTCNNCGSAFNTYGRMWMGSLYKPEILNGLQKHFNTSAASKKELSFFEVISNELNTPFYYSLPKLTKKMRMSSVSIYSVMECLKKKGFAVTKTQFDADSIKTTAGIKEVTSCVKNSYR